MNKIVFEFCAEDRARLDKLAEMLEKFALVTVTADLPQISVPEAGGNYSLLPQGEEAKPETQVEPEKVENVPVVTLEDLQAKAMEFVKAGKKDILRGIVSEYADKLSGIPENKRAEVMQKLIASEG